jgi:hypothetical protein
MIKLAGDNGAHVYDRPFNTVITRKMIMTLLKEGIRSNDELSRWLDTNAVGRVKPIWNPSAIP